MSMVTLTLIQTTLIFFLYSILTVLVPAFVLGSRFSHRRFTERVLFYYLFGNFYVMNLVFVLELLHISNRFTLIIGTLAPAFFAWVRINHIPVERHVRQFFTNIRRFSGGQLGRRNAWLHFRIWIKEHCGPKFKFLWKLLYSNLIEWAFVILLLIVIIWIYGAQIITNFGYCVSDLPVHNYWINYMNYNQIFVAGIYPFGFHCMVYYMHQVFGLDTYVILRVFGIVQTIYIFFMLLAFLKLSCKTKYLPYAGAVFAVAFGGYNYSSYFRYGTALPQEYGMIFILPAVYFLFQFFEERKEEIKAETKPKASRYCLFAFGMSFAMTLAVHFYDTMIAGLFCIGIAVGYVWWIFRRKYFWNILAAGLLSILVAVLPMVIAFAMGRPLQGSLGWGMNVIKGDPSSGTTIQKSLPENADTDGEVRVFGADGELLYTTEYVSGTESAAAIEEPEQKVSAWEKLTGLWNSIVRKLSEKAKEFYKNEDELLRRDVIRYDFSWMVNVYFITVGAVFLMGIFFWIIRQGFYGGRLVSSAIYMFLMMFMLAAGRLGFPSLMNTQRTSIYLTYSFPIVLVFIGDGIAYLVRLVIRWKRSMQILSLAMAIVFLYGLFSRGWVKDQVFLSPLETNGAIICLTNIIEEEEDFTWTICSANDERNMALDHAYHYELITFLREMEGEDREDAITIPSESVYFFVEKIPTNYGGAYAGSGRKVSTEGADHPLSNGGGNSAYVQEQRWITMSRFYYWAKAFQKLYPNEMKVYYETDEFICYKLEQNPYRLYNLSIDYDYNTRTWENEEDEALGIT